MNMQTALTLFVIVIACLWGYLGWHKGAVFEARGLLVTFFSMLAALRLWHPVAGILGDALGNVALAVPLAFFALFFAARIVVSYALNIRAKDYKPAEDNTPDKGIGVATGFASGLLMGSTLALLVTVAFAGIVPDFSKPAPKRIEQLPIALFRFVENGLSHVPENARTLLPAVKLNPENPDGTELAWE